MEQQSIFHKDSFDMEKFRAFGHQLDDVMELINTAIIKTKLVQVEKEFEYDPSEINKVRLGIIDHEVALNLSFFSKTEFKGYAKKSFDILTELFNSNKTALELTPFIASYRASDLSLIVTETQK